MLAGFEFPESGTISIDGIDMSQVPAYERPTPINKIALKASISGAAVHQRIKKLEASGVISGSHIKLNTKVLGYKTMAFIGVFLDKAMNNLTAVNKLNKIPEVLECGRSRKLECFSKVKLRIFLNLLLNILLNK